VGKPAIAEAWRSGGGSGFDVKVLWLTEVVGLRDDSRASYRRIGPVLCRILFAVALADPWIDRKRSTNRLEGMRVAMSFGAVVGRQRLSWAIPRR
jgi:hypothetical protein